MIIAIIVYLSAFSLVIKMAISGGFRKRRRTAPAEVSAAPPDSGEVPDAGETAAEEGGEQARHF